MPNSQTTGKDTTTAIAKLNRDVLPIQGNTKIEYDYNKPSDYKETDEVITGVEMNQSLTDLFSKK